MNPGFDLNLLWAAAAGLAVGAALVFLLLRRGGSVNRERAESLATELEETQLELESHREEVAKHFSQTSDLFRDLTEQYSRLYSHLATGARDFCPDEVPSLGHGLETPPLVDEAVQARYGDDDAERSPEGEPEQQAEAEAPAAAADEPARAEAAADEPARAKAAADEPARAEAAEPKEGEERMAVDAPVPGAAPPPVGKKPNGGSHLTH